MIALALLTTAAPLAQSDAPTDSPQGGSAVEEVVVTARPGRPPAPLDPVGFYRRFCFDAARLTGRFAPPYADPAWTPLDDEARGRFRMADPSAPAYGIADAARGHRLLVKFERIPPSGAWRVVEDRCTLVVIGGRDHQAVVGRLSALFGASGTERHVGERDGVPALRGWRQWLWSGMPARGSRSWRALRRDSGRSTESAWLHVFDPRFYDEYDYLLADLKVRGGEGPPFSALSFARIHRPRTRNGAAVDDASSQRKRAAPTDRPSRNPIRLDQKSR